MSFVIRQFENHLTIGQKLRSMRLELNLTISDMAKMTKIRASYLEAFENDNHDRLPESLYTRNFLRRYVRTLNGDEIYFLERFERESKTCDVLNEAHMPRQRVSRLTFISANRYTKIALGSLFVLALITYLGSQVQSIVSPPELVLLSPSDGYVTENATVMVSGFINNEGSVTINGAETLLDKKGQFETEIVLERGLNVIEIKGRKRYSRPAEVLRRVVLEREEDRTLGRY